MEDTVFVEQRDDCLGVRPAARQEHRHHVLLFNQLAWIFGRQLGVELVVEGDQLNLLPFDATLGIESVDVVLCALSGTRVSSRSFGKDFNPAPRVCKSSA